MTMASNSKTVTVAGGANVDIYGRPVAALLDYDSNPGSIMLVPGGVARNVAENLARLAVDVELISCIGRDHYGRMLADACREAGVGTDYLAQQDALPTSTYLAILDDSGDLRIAVSDMELVEQLGPAHLQKCEESLKNSALLVLDTNLSEEAIGWLTRNFGARPVFVDTVSAAKAPRIRPFLAAVHTIKTSKTEAERLSRINAVGPDDYESIARWFHEQGVDRLFMTLGEQGVFYSTAESRGRFNLQFNCRDISNTGGAGDAFLAGMAFAWLERYPLEETLRFAMAAAAVTLACAGTNNPDFSRETIAAKLEQTIA